MSCCQNNPYKLCDIAVCAGEPVVIDTKILQLPNDFNKFFAELYFKNSVIKINPIPTEHEDPQPLKFELQNPNENYCYKMVIYQIGVTVLGNLGNRKVVEFEIDSVIYNALSFCTIYKKSNC